MCKYDQVVVNAKFQQIAVLIVKLKEQCAVQMHYLITHFVTMDYTIWTTIWGTNIEQVQCSDEKTEF